MWSLWLIPLRIEQVFAVLFASRTSFVGRVQPASYIEKVRGLHSMRAKQSQKDLFSAFGTLILERLATAGAFLS